MQQLIQCPRCGAQNYQGQPSCWHCASPLMQHNQGFQPPPSTTPIYQHQAPYQQAYQQQAYQQQTAHQQPSYQQSQQQTPYQQSSVKKGVKSGSDLLATCRTTLTGGEVIVRAVQFFTNERWRPMTQSERIATFMGRPPIPWGLIFLAFIGLFFLILPGLLIYFIVIRRVIRFQNLVVTTSVSNVGTDVTVTYPKYARKLVERFIELLPAATATY